MLSRAQLTSYYRVCGTEMSREQAQASSLAPGYFIDQVIVKTKSYSGRKPKRWSCHRLQRRLGLQPSLQAAIRKLDCT
jgi:hypothetical protein